MGKGELPEIISSKVHETFKTFEIVTILMSESYHILINYVIQETSKGYLLPRIFFQSLLK